MAQNYMKLTITILPETHSLLSELAKKKCISISAVSRLLLSSGTEYLKEEWEVN
jgi:hypothetical protein